MFLKEIWRYPVKSLGGESLPAATLTPLGLAGDRQILVASRRTGRIITARTHHRLLGHHATINSEGEVLIDGLPWREAAESISDTLSESVTLVEHTGPERFDILPLLVATDGAIAHQGIDGRRLRPNLVIGGVEGLTERTWPGKQLRIGPTQVAPAQLRGRCVMTTYDPDTLEQDMNVLRRIVKDLDGVMALDTAVVTPGPLAVGDPVTLLD